MRNHNATVRQMSDTLIDLHVAHLRAGGKADATINARTWVLHRLDQHLPYGLAFAATEQIENWLAELADAGRKANTLWIYTHHAVAFFRWACLAGYLDGDPTTTITSPRRRRGIPKPVTAAEFARVMDLPEPVRTASALAGLAGLRVGEIAACRREHLTEEMILIPSGKGGQPGTVPTHPYLWQVIEPRPPGPLVTDRHGQAVTAHWLSACARRCFGQAGLPEVHLHRLRHYYGTTIQQLCGDIRVTQECMRHRSIQSTQGYTLVTRSQREAAVRAIPAPGAPAGSEPAGAAHGHSTTP